VRIQIQFKEKIMKPYRLAVLPMVLFLLSTQVSMPQKKDSILQKIDELKKVYQKKDFDRCASLAREIQEFVSGKVSKASKDTLPQSKSTGLPPLSRVLKDAAFGTTEWSLSIQFKSADYPAITHEDFMKALDSFRAYSPPEEYQQALKLKAEMQEAFKWFTMYCDNIAAFLPNSSKRPIPFRFADKDGKKCVILTDLASSSVYNTLRSTSMVRASKVLTSCLIPKVKFLFEAFEKADIDYLGMTIVYGSKDFASEESDALNLKAEMLAFVAPKEKCKQFAEGAITESEFVAVCDAYLCDRDMMFDYKKIKLEIE
jgi:mannose/fructose-specific phosphotransferase system component IIA